MLPPREDLVIDAQWYGMPGQPYKQEPFTQTMATTWPGSDDVSENTRG